MMGEIIPVEKAFVRVMYLCKCIYSVAQGSVIPRQEYVNDFVEG